MKLFIIADIHGNAGKLPFVESVISDCDGIVLAGDITDFGGKNEALSVLSALEVYGKPLFGVPGNCDLPGVDEVLQQRHAGLHGICVEFNGFQFVGVGGSLACSGATPNEAGEHEFRDILEKAVACLPSKDDLVLVTHQPAWGCDLDRSGAGRHTGSRAIRTFIEQYHPILAISGHMHDAYGVDKIGSTVMVNPGPFRQGRYAVVEVNNRRVQVELYPK